LQEKKSIVQHEIDWSMHELFFSNMPFDDVARELAVRYGVNIVIENEALRQRRITALLDSRNSIDELMKILSASQRATYTVQGNTYRLR
jgi:ferric-dicitrate binding protein FerR (iron transport regulator)